MKARQMFVGSIVACCMSATPVLAGIWEYHEDFEFSNPARTKWFPGPGAGFDFDRGLAHVGKGNAWVRNRAGWSAVNVWITPHADTALGDNCKVGAWIRMSDDVTDGYFSVRSGDGTTFGPPLKELKLVGPNRSNPPNANYNLFTFDFRATGGPMLFYVGNWGNGKDNWIQLDDFSIQCHTPF